jgi:pilus assembly protein CpaC
MKTAAAFIFLVLFTITPLNSFAGDLLLKVGEVRTLAAPNKVSVRVGSRAILKVVDGENIIRVVALKPGATTLAIGAQALRVRVASRQQLDFVHHMKASVNQMMGLKLDWDSGEVQVRGTLLRFSDWLELAHLAREHQGEYIFKAQALQDVAEHAMTHFRELATQKGLPILRFVATPQFTAYLPKASQNLKAMAERELNPYGIRVEMMESQLSIEPMIKTQVILAEVTRSQSEDFGVQWPSEYEAKMLPNFVGSGPLLVRLKALESKGQAQILASPNLLCRSGGQARFHAGGEFPIRLISRQTQDVVWKSYGVLLNVKPKADYQGSMSVEIETEVSMLDMANAVDGIPAIKKSTVRSHFDLTGKRTIALSGLIKQELGRNREGLPLLSQIPILGNLFSSQKYLNHQSELVIFVTPEIRGSSGDETQMPKGWIQDEN